MIKRSSPHRNAAWGTGLAPNRWKWPCLITAAIASLGLSGPTFATEAQGPTFATEAQYECSGGDRPRPLGSSPPRPTLRGEASR